MNGADETSYACPACGEEIELYVDLSAGREQEFVQDCPVCCRPTVLRVHVAEDGAVSIVPSAE